MRGSTNCEKKIGVKILYYFVQIITESTCQHDSENIKNVWSILRMKNLWFFEVSRSTDTLMCIIKSKIEIGYWLDKTL